MADGRGGEGGEGRLDGGEQGRPEDEGGQRAVQAGLAGHGELLVVLRSAGEAAVIVPGGTHSSQEKHESQPSHQEPDRIGFARGTDRLGGSGGIPRHQPASGGGRGGG
ncbi:hypothetical protein GCM10022197_12650 [Microlunatus spumicola]|uniref:Uncharacterized protein n=1 Tax=Microlunatus spumicola TaxID=81499 RepID=A0ABP6X148_9ACTN